ncbi:hypothetical protein SAMN05428988_0442 [Chitinophaga sp. YR573]|uniref:fibronectin type III domain-containing protein n=1 Tax=Chitinophaga sp. YR573 TaxID=1881040 RepID=UPI0008CCBC58|nr:fibronectin type III domain-containing protein [Chitinophaga sp. YR573]SEV91895.1 hypothetical protein SAMN05428988_0442 [Chitinophaga sp. YR573]
MKRVFTLFLLSAALFSCSKKEEDTDPPIRIDYPSWGSMQFSDTTSESIKISVTANKPFKEVWPVIYYREAASLDSSVGVLTRLELPDSIYTIGNLKPGTAYVFELFILDYDVYSRLQRSVVSTSK